MATNTTMMKKPTYKPLAIHKKSHTLSKPTPKIRIIHVFAPEIIKTDKANFRELVQRLTGKPNDFCKKKTSRRDVQEETTGFHHNYNYNYNSISITQTNVFQKEEEEMNSGGFLSGFADLDGFIMQELGGDQFPCFTFEDLAHQIS